VILRETTELDPRVVEALRAARRRFEKNGLEYALVGGVLLNQLGVGRPTFDIDFVVKKKDWQKAVSALAPLCIDSERMGLPGEPSPAALLKSKKGPWYEVFPQGISAGKIAELRGQARSHKASDIAFKLKADPVVQLIDTKLASYLSAKDRLRDLSDIQRLARQLGLGADFAARLDPRIKSTFLREVLAD
jgi:hypothetical protein